MIYLLDGKETYYLSKKKNELLNHKDLTKDNIITIDGSSKDTTMNDIYSLCNTVSLFSEKRAVIVDNPSFLKAKTGTKTEKKKKDNTDISILDSYCKAPNEDTDLIFYCFGYDADKRTKEYQVLDSYVGKTVNHMHFGEPQGYELTNIIDKCLKEREFKLTRNARTELINRINGSITLFYYALDKLDLYGKKELNETDIEHLVSSNVEINRWKLGNAFLSGNVEQAFRAYQDMIDIDGMQIIGVIAVLASQIRGVYNSMICHEEGMLENDIKKYTKRNYPMKDISSASRFNSTDLLEMLKELADIEQGIKAGILNDKISFENFLVRNT